MSAQLNLLTPPRDDPVAVPICRSVLYSGSRARTEDALREPLFPHRHVPPAPPRLAGGAVWLAVLDFAEAELRFQQAGRAILDLDRGGGKGCSGGRAGPSGPTLRSSSRGVEVDSTLLGWPQLLRGLREQREVELGVARARDLAEAYHCLDYYGRVYPEPKEGEEWSPVPLIRRIAEEAIELGGEPTRLRPHTSYMRQGIAEAAR
jgi:hypothetical protein